MDRISSVAGAVVSFSGGALDHLGLTAWNQNEHHANTGLSAIDLICGPQNVCVTHVERIDPYQNRRQLSDHAGYVVDIK